MIAGDEVVQTLGCSGATTAVPWLHECHQVLAVPHFSLSASVSLPGSPAPCGDLQHISVSQQKEEFPHSSVVGKASGVGLIQDTHS